MIEANQDDNEFRCGGHHILTPEETSKVRAGESAAVAKLLGIKAYDIWQDIDDCNNKKNDEIYLKYHPRPCYFSQNKRLPRRPSCHRPACSGCFISGDCSARMFRCTGYEENACDYVL